jgi:hypothetical protein
VARSHADVSETIRRSRNPLLRSAGLHCGRMDCCLTTLTRELIGIQSPGQRTQQKPLTQHARIPTRPLVTQGGIERRVGCCPGMLRTRKNTRPAKRCGPVEGMTLMRPPPSVDWLECKPRPAYRRSARRRVTAIRRRTNWLRRHATTERHSSTFGALVLQASNRPSHASQK